MSLLHRDENVTEEKLEEISNKVEFLIERAQKEVYIDKLDLTIHSFKYLAALTTIFAFLFMNLFTQQSVIFFYGHGVKS